VQAEFEQPVLVLSLCNDALGYAPERESFSKEDNHAAKLAAYVMAYPPFAPTMEDELVGETIKLVREVTN